MIYLIVSTSHDHVKVFLSILNAISSIIINPIPSEGNSGRLVILYLHFVFHWKFRVLEYQIFGLDWTVLCLRARACVPHVSENDEKLFFWWILIAGKCEFRLGLEVPRPHPKDELCGQARRGNGCGGSYRYIIRTLLAAVFFSKSLAPRGEGRSL